MLNDYEGSNEDLLKNSEKTSMNLRRTRLLCTEIYESINNLNQKFMKNLFKDRKTNRTQWESGE